MVDLVVSAFEPFGGQPVNPSAEAVRALARSRRFGAAIQFVILPVTYRGAFEVLAARVARERPRGCLMFGLGHRGALRVEQWAYNAMDCALADNAGVREHGSPLVRHGPATIETQGPVASVRSALEQARAPVELSDDPGRFVCNATYYKMLTGPLPGAGRSLFVHVPPTHALGGDVADEQLVDWVAAGIDGYLAGLI